MSIGSAGAKVSACSHQAIESVRPEMRGESIEVIASQLIDDDEDDQSRLVGDPILSG